MRARVALPIVLAACALSACSSPAPAAPEPTSGPAQPEDALFAESGSGNSQWSVQLGEMRGVAATITCQGDDTVRVSVGEAWVDSNCETSSEDTVVGTASDNDVIDIAVAAASGTQWTITVRDARSLGTSP